MPSKKASKTIKKKTANSRRLKSAGKKKESTSKKKVPQSSSRDYGRAGKKRKTKTAKKPVKKSPSQKPATRKSSKSVSQKTSKLANKKTSRKKAVKKTKRVKQAITFGLLKKEVDEILENTPADNEFAQNISKELAKVLPDNEKITTKSVHGEPSIIIKNSSENKVHSPFVLDLNELLEKKNVSKQKKDQVRAFFCKNKSEKQALKADHLQIEQHENKKAKKHKNSKSKIYHTQFTRQPVYYHLNLPYRWYRALATYILIGFLLIIPISALGYYKNLKNTQDKAIEHAQNAIHELKNASQSLSIQNLDQANQDFLQANYDFKQATYELEDINSALKTILKIIPTSANLSDAEYLLETGESAAILGTELTQIFNSFAAAGEAPLTNKLNILRTGLEKIIPKVKLINYKLSQIQESAIPENYQNKFTSIKQTIANLNSDLNELNSLSSILMQLLGQDYKKSYLFVFQNSNELRPTGGFIGSFARVDIDRGQITKIEMPGQGIYAQQAALLKRTLPPNPLQLVNEEWEWQDANWFADFPTSAQKIKWFYEKSGGPTVDGVIAINVDIIPQLLALTGPIEMPDYNITLNQNNFINEIQYHVELAYDKETNAPKQILSDLAPKLLEKLFELKGNQLLDLARTTRNSLNNKNIQLYFRENDAQEKFSSYNWTGEIKNSSRDYLAVVSSNIGGGKTNNFIKQKVNLFSNILENGEIVNTLQITRTHTGTIENTFGSASNIDFLRIYTPQGSSLISAQGFSSAPKHLFKPANKFLKHDPFLIDVQGSIVIDAKTQTQINNEFNKTVFGNWLILEPGETKTITLTYKLPFKLNLNKERSLLARIAGHESKSYYSLFVQKQSGLKNTDYQFEFELPNDNSQAVYPESLSITGRSVKKISDHNTPSTDELIAFVIPNNYD